jgi:microcystin-dependent protein
MTSHLGRRLLSAAAASFALLATAPGAQAGTSPYLGEIMVTIDDICPTGWSPAKGQTMQIAQNSALFSLLGVKFGGDGVRTFNLPDLRGRTVVGAGLSSTGDHPLGGFLNLGETGGSESTFLTQTVRPVQTSPNAKTAATGTIAAAQAIPPAPITTLPPWIGLTVCIATSGRFPSQN